MQSNKKPIEAKETECSMCAQLEWELANTKEKLEEIISQLSSLI